MLTRDDVIAAYRLVLGRPPEDDETIRMQMDTNADFSRLRHSLFTSPEFLDNALNDGALNAALTPVNIAMNAIRPKQNGRRRFGLRTNQSH